MDDLDELLLRACLTAKAKTRTTYKPAARRLTDAELKSFLPDRHHEPPVIILPPRTWADPVEPNPQPPIKYRVPSLSTDPAARYVGKAVPVDNVILAPLTNGKIEHYQRQGKYGTKAQLRALGRQAEKQRRKLLKLQIKHAPRTPIQPTSAYLSLFD